jgi:hypothetical protein
LHAQDAEPSPLRADEFYVFVKNEEEKWIKVVRDTGMTVE